LSKLLHNQHLRKKEPKNLGDFCNFYESAQIKISPTGAKFTQSGHSEQKARGGECSSVNQSLLYWRIAQKVFQPNSICCEEMCKKKNIVYEKADFGGKVGIGSKQAMLLFLEVCAFTRNLAGANLKIQKHF
jgi:hypothetical protein